MKFDIEHYIKIHKYHEENRVSTEQRNRYWREYNRLQKIESVDI